MSLVGGQDAAGPLLGVEGHRVVAKVLQPEGLDALFKDERTLPEGAAPEIVLDGETGFVVDSESEMAEAIKRLGEIDPARCRESAEERSDVSAVAAAHERAYREAMDSS